MSFKEFLFFLYCQADACDQSLEDAESSLELALQTLSSRLSSVVVASHSAGIEPSAIRDTVEGIIKVLQTMQAVEEVRKLRGDGGS